MIGRSLGTVVIGLLLVLAISLPWLSRRGSEAALRMDAPDAVGSVGQALPDFLLYDLDGEPVRLADFRGQRVLLTFERSIDW